MAKVKVSLIWTHLAVLDLLQCAVVAHSEDAPGVMRECHAGVAARLQHALGLALAAQGIPLVHGSVHPTRHHTTVVSTPHH